MQFAALPPRKRELPEVPTLTSRAAVAPPKRYPFMPLPKPITDVKAVDLFENTVELVKPPNSDNPIADWGGRYFGEVFHAYLLYECYDSLYVIDKHAAHERILYEALKNRGPESGMQTLLSPVVVTADPVEAAALTEALPELEEAGFPLEVFGENTFALRMIPLEYTGMSETALSEIILIIADELLRGGKAASKRAELWDKTLYSIACKAAMKAGRMDEDRDCIWIIESLKDLKNIFVCPHGRPICARFDKPAFEKLFFRK